MRHVILLASIALTFISARASADAISPPPDACTEGSEPLDFCHGPPTCQALTCESDADCESGACRERALCVREHCCSGMACITPESAEHVTHVEGSCAGGEACDESSCQTLKVCVPASTVEDAGNPPDAGDGGASGGGCCSATGTRSGAAGALFLALILATFVRRARR